MNRTRLTLLTISLLVAGCASSSDRRTQETVTRRADGITETATREPGLATERATRAGGRMVFEQRVPSTATDVTQRTTLTDGPYRNDSALVARLAENGQVWLVEPDTGRIIYSGSLRQGDTFLVNLTRNEASLNGRPLSAVTIDGSRAYRIYFLPGR